MPLTRDSHWKIPPPPELREPLSFTATFTADELSLLENGLVPQEMEDKWLVFWENDWLTFHRSRTGFQIYGVRIQRSREGGGHVSDSWINRDPQQYRGQGVAYERKLLRFLIDALMLNRPAKFPMPAGFANTPPGLLQHSLVGRAFPEEGPDERIDRDA